MTRVFLVAAVLVAASPAIPDVSATGSFGARKGCDHIHRSSVAYERLRTLLRHTRPEVRKQRVSHYATCVATWAKAHHAHELARKWWAWRKRNVCTPARGNVALGRCMAARDYGWSGGEFSCLYTLWSHESGWSTYAHNSSSGAHGIPQALPGSKMGPGWESDPVVQIRWGLGYVRGRYGTPCGALGHFNSNGWY